MTILQKRIKELGNNIKELEENMRSLKSERILECEFKVDEKVRVFDKSERYFDFLGEGFIKFILVDNEGNFRYKIKKAKKDGTESKFYFSEYHTYRIEKL